MTDSGLSEISLKSINNQEIMRLLKKMSVKLLQYEKDEYLCIKGIVMAIIAC